MSGRSGRRQQQPPPKSTGFVAHVYEEDYREIQKLVQQYPEIETGGDLFGLWQDESTVVIQLFIGPGKNCSRTTTSFHQDIDYLKKVGSVITTEDGLCNVGEWHSHHQIGMPGPSSNDCRTVFSNMPQLGLERFVLFIASIESKVARRKRPYDVELEDIVLRPYLFLASRNKYIQGEIEIIDGKNPHIESSRARSEIEKGAAEPPVEYLQGKKPDKKKQGKEKHQVPEFSRETKPKSAGGISSSTKFYDKNFNEKRDDGRDVNDENQTPNMSSTASKKGSSPPTTPPPSGAAHDLRSGHPGGNDAPSGLWGVFENAPQSGSGRGISTSSSGSHRPQQMTSHSTATQPRTRSQGQERSARDGAIPIGKMNASGYF